VRFNPDAYYYNDKQIDSYRGREERLKNVLIDLKNNVKEIDCPIGVIYLFYDNFDNVKIEPLTYNIENGIMTITHKHPLQENPEHVFIL